MICVFEISSELKNTIISLRTKLLPYKNYKLIKKLMWKVINIKRLIYF